MARFMLASTIAVLLVVVAPGCKDSKTPHETVLVDGLDKMKEMTGVLKSITDESSAKAAMPRLEALAGEIQKISEKASKLPKPSDDEDKKLMKKYESEMKTVLADLRKETLRVQSIKGVSATLKNTLRNVR